MAPSSLSLLHAALFLYKIHFTLPVLGKDLQAIQALGWTNLINEIGNEICGAKSMAQ